MKQKIFVLGIALLTITSLYYIYVVLDARSSTLNKIIAAKAQVEYPLAKSDLSEKQLLDLLTVQDSNFYRHKGTDFLGRRVTTITQSLVKFLFFEEFTPGIAKIKQSLIARFALDPLLSKDEQLELFLNLTYFGKVDGLEVRGFGKASKIYFDKYFKDLSEEEYFKLLAMLSGPNLYSIKINPKKNAEQVAVLRKLLGS
jgi:membrane carboxypeptidase/penicillin-binding protein